MIIILMIYDADTAIQLSAATASYADIRIASADARDFKMSMISSYS